MATIERKETGAFTLRQIDDKICDLMDNCDGPAFARLYSQLSDGLSATYDEESGKILVSALTEDE